LKRRTFAACAGLAALAAPFHAAWAQNYPSRPIRLVVPFPAGGATDLFARELTQAMGEKMGATFVVDNKPGAGGAIGSTAVANAQADGYTLLLATTSTHAIGPLITKTPYDVVRDFSPIAHVGDAPSIMLVPVDSPAKTVREWIDLARKNPGKLNYASSGIGTIVQLTAELFNAQAGVSVTHIPYKGTALSIPDLISGKVDVLFDSLPTGMPHVRDGKLRALGVTSLKRSPLAPELPAIAETVPGFESNTWFGLYGPKDLPAALVARLNLAANEALADAQLRARFAKLGIEPSSSSPQDLAALQAQDTAKWRKIITGQHISLQ